MDEKYRPTNTLQSDEMYLNDNKLGLSYFIIPDLYSYCFDSFQKSSKEDEDILKWTKIILLINAENYTVWNHRKSYVVKCLKSLNLSTNEKQSLIQNELKLLSLIFTKHPKSVEAWSHREFTLKHLYSILSQQYSATSDSTLALEPIYKALINESALCEKILHYYAKNYYCWTFRYKVLTLFYTAFLEGTSSSEAPHHNSFKQTLNKYICAEIENTNKWIARNVSDHCSVHHLQLLLLSLHNGSFLSRHKASQQFSTSVAATTVPQRETDDTVLSIQAWKKEFENVKKLIHLYPGHEVLWLHLRFFVLHFCKEFKQCRMSWNENIETKNGNEVTSFKEESEFARGAAEKAFENKREQKRCSLVYEWYLVEMVLNQPRNNDERREPQIEELGREILNQLKQYDELRSGLWTSKWEKSFIQ